jgi:hypothetical protein
VAVNDAFRLDPDADVLYAADAMWWRIHAQDALKFAGLKVTVGGGNCEFPAVLALGNGGLHGIEDRPTHLRTGMNGSYQAMQVALHFGARRIIFLGLDMHRPKGKAHFFGDHPPRLNRESPYASFIREFECAAPLVKQLGVEVFNCTPGSALKCFPIEPLEVTLARSTPDP